MVRVFQSTVSLCYLHLVTSAKVSQGHLEHRGLAILCIDRRIFFLVALLGLRCWIVRTPPAIQFNRSSAQLKDTCMFRTTTQVSNPLSLLKTWSNNLKWLSPVSRYKSKNHDCDTILLKYTTASFDPISNRINASSARVTYCYKVQQQTAFPGVIIMN